MRILLVEDDPLTRTVLAQTLSDHHYSVDVAKDGQAGLELTHAYNYDLILLDVVLPLLDGISLCQQLRSQGFQEPIVLLTAKESNTDQIIGLDAGADDYIIKPFNLETLMARIRALLRRKKAILSSVIEWENLQLNLNNCEVTSQGNPIHLTAKEYSLLELFLVNPKRIFSRRIILERLWDMTDSPGEETISTHIKCLRQKLKAAGVPDPIETVYGLGYRLKSSNQQKKVLDLTSKVWKKFQNLYVKQVALLEEAVQALLEDNLTVELREKAKKEAHKLAGSLGIFGLMNSSKIARQIEQILESKTQLKKNERQQIINGLVLLKQEIEQTANQPGAAPILPSNTPLILMIDDDLALAERIRIEALPWNLQVEIATDLTVARQIIIQTPPDLILLDLNFESDTEDGFTLLEELCQSMGNIPVAVFTGRESLGDRVKVARLGAKAFLHKPLPAHEILKTITDLFNHNRLLPKNQIMIVDDDPLTLTTLVELLKPWGVEVITLKKPDQFWKVFTANAPDLLVLDLEMPKFNGLELCKVVRNDPKWQDLPIVFLSIHTEEKVIQQMFAAGADDYMSKSNDGTELVTRIIRRLKVKEKLLT